MCPLNRGKINLHCSLGINQRTIRHWFKKGRLKGVRVGKEWYIPEVNLKEFFNIRHFITTSEFESAVKEIGNMFDRQKVTKETKEAQKLIKRFVRLKEDMVKFKRKQLKILRVGDKKDKRQRAKGKLKKKGGEKIGIYLHEKI